MARFSWRVIRSPSAGITWLQSLKPRAGSHRQTRQDERCFRGLGQAFNSELINQRLAVRCVLADRFLTAYVAETGTRCSRESDDTAQVASRVPSKLSTPGHYRIAFDVMPDAKHPTLPLLNLTRVTDYGTMVQYAGDKPGQFRMD